MQKVAFCKIKPFSLRYLSVIKLFKFWIFNENVMKKILFILLTIFSFMVSSCTSGDEVKEISGTLLFNEVGSHKFNINAENIQATITMVAPNKGEIYIFENVTLNRAAEYTAKIGVEKSSNFKTELLNNLVVMYEAKSGENLKNIVDKGFVKIDWIGYDY